MIIKKSKTVVERVEIGAICDVCRKLIYLRDPDCKSKKEFKDFYRVTTGHNDWGNDSVDSIEHHQVCSVECANELLKMYFERACDKKDERNTEYIEIEHCWTYSDPNATATCKNQLFDECGNSYIFEGAE